MEYAEQFQKLEELLKAHNPGVDLTMLEKAFALASEKHKDQKRKSGEPFIIHPVAVATMLAEMDMDMPSVIAGMLHDVVEDTSVTIEEIREIFGDEIAYLVDGVTKLKRIPTSTKEELQNENLRKMFLSMASDIRVIVIKLVDRLHNMRTLQYVNTDAQITKARETLEIYTPLAHRLGMTKIKWELEDLCFKYLEPEAYNSLVTQITQRRDQQEAYIKKVLDAIRIRLDEAGIKAFLDGRPKHFYSIHKKMIAQNKALNQIYDLLAIRVIVDTVQECYTVLGIIHEMYTPMPGRFKDYIAMPKPNMYQSLHTTLIGPDGQPFEAQIRTWEMHKTAEIGIAAHWKYKEGGKNGKTSDYDGKLEWVRNLLDNQREVEDPDEFVETFKMDLFTDEVFVFTPKGDVKCLPKGSTPIDFAYAIHSAVGNRMIGAKVNGEIKPLNYKLCTGDFVEIITSQSNHGPSRDWLNIVKSSEAKSKIRQWFKKECRDENIERGKEIIERELKKQGFRHEQLFKTEWLEPILKKYKFSSYDDLLNVIGFGELSAQKIVNMLKEEYQKSISGSKEEELLAKLEASKNPKKERQKQHASDNGIIVKGIDNCLVRLSRCCNPVPGDSIVGYITRGRGVSVHRTDCPNIVAMSELENRVIDVRWAEKSKSSYIVDISIKAVDNSNLLLQIAKLIAESKLPMKAINARTTRDHYELIDLTVEITDRSELDKLAKKINGMENVVEVSRTVK
ncbi:MAG TPA: bifunctional (p)ppGpp synthetase/guanosine-3',5'-bis(diphosphate) 3'-pyrophosphohydrolase [Candidatus Egerieisoma faecipullorum]|uniref:GTP diphosphokinase n=1 Tax=Candidatus Egerieisoma faecipullorum TaxID=2840963 RepID=A0A9D1LAL7_9CLOT|nr:bifunctional (p)ppGpp synthetase/guanosine-3',5'-bis(diphosphate) 3'-pyrophosphohydrolase [Candidatus Egerieisoma faecipullorum]